MTQIWAQRVIRDMDVPRHLRMENENGILVTMVEAMDFAT